MSTLRGYSFNFIRCHNRVVTMFLGDPDPRDPSSPLAFGGTLLPYYFSCRNCKFENFPFLLDL